MTKITIVLLVIIIMPFYAQNSVYHNENGKFSFIIPTGWIEIPKHIIDSTAKILNIDTWDAGFQRADKNFISYPFFLIKITKEGSVSESEIQEIINEIINNEIKNQVNGIKKELSHIILSLQLNEVRYDSSMKAIFCKTEGSVIGVGKVNGLTATMLGNLGAVIISFSSTKNNFENDLVYFDQVISSFKYDEGYEYTRASSELSDKRTVSHKLSIPSFLTIIPIIFLLSMIIFGIRYLLWRDEVPLVISRLRWLIAIIMGIIAVIVEYYLGVNISSVSTINGLVVFATAQALKKRKKD